MQRVLVMIRHAKSSWSNPLQSDFERPLNSRGEEDAPEIGLRLLNSGIIPDLIISSTAKRAKQTAKRIARSVKYSEEQIIWEEKLYHCIPSVFEETLYEVSDDIKTVFIIAHNPGITDFANHLTNDFAIDHMPTCGAIAARFEAKEWSEFSGVKKEIILFEYPKK